MTTFSSKKTPKISSSNDQNPFEFDLDKILGAIDMKDSSTAINSDHQVIFYSLLFSFIF